MAFLAIKSIWQNKGKGYPSMTSQAVTGSAAINRNILFRPIVVQSWGHALMEVPLAILNQENSIRVALFFPYTIR